MLRRTGMVSKNRTLALVGIFLTKHSENGEQNRDILVEEDWHPNHWGVVIPLIVYAKETVISSG